MRCSVAVTAEKIAKSTKCYDIARNAFETVLSRAHSFALPCAIARLISINKQTDARRYPRAQTRGCGTRETVVIMRSLSRRWMTTRAWEARRQDVKRRSRGAATCKGWGTKDEGMFSPGFTVPHLRFRGFCFARVPHNVRDKIPPRNGYLDASSYWQLQYCNIDMPDAFEGFQSKAVIL